MKRLIYLLFCPFIFSCVEKSNKARPGPDTASVTVNEQTFLELGGEKQYVEITGTTPDKPVLLFLHGGPGWPQTPHLRYFNAGISDSMTLVAWEQRGCGKSYMQNPAAQNMSLERIVEDGHELTLWLKEKFWKDRIYLAGFSWGSVVGLKLIEKYPEDYAAYFGIAQVLNIRQSIKRSRIWIAEQARGKDDIQTLRVLDQLEKGDTSLCKGELNCFLKQHELLSKYGGAIFSKEAEKEIQKAETQYEDYKNYDWFAAFKYSAEHLEKDMFEVDLTGIRSLKIPVYFLLGRHDWNLVSAITEEFAKQLNAPHKEIIWFEQSGHEPLEEEAGKFNTTIIHLVGK
ncbi:MAG TPA: alpha/beta hydrolase [Saprospiraceae bacterium]|nr:alpha/beta hydrolase [Saprospiraceae bacterium]HNT21457.1 alpha/beta hydrolase [Saprospiraceae bacterium]